jgi:biopolymer transport protein ExbB
LIFGLGVIIERVIYLNLATTNTTKLLAKVEDSLKAGNLDGAKEVCRNTRGPIASIFYQGLERSGEGIDIAEKAVTSYGSVQMGQLEKGMIWISLFIALAPMLGFLGTVVGMIQAFDAIEIAGDISPSLVAGGIKVALLTTVFGLIVAMILQVFYNYLISKVDSLVNTMEDASISLMDLLVKYGKK